MIETCERPRKVKYINRYLQGNRIVAPRMFPGLVWQTLRQHCFNFLQVHAQTTEGDGMYGRVQAQGNLQHTIGDNEWTSRLHG